MLVRTDCLIAAVDHRYLKIDQRVTRNRSALRCLDDSFLDGGPEILRHRAAKDLVHPFETSAAIERFEDAFAITELSAPTGLFLVAALHLDLLSDRFLVRHLRRMQGDLD